MDLHQCYLSEYKAPVDADAVGIDSKTQEVMELLDVSGGGPARAVILYGFGGVGKTTLANSVMAKLDFTGFKQSRILLDDEPSDVKKYREQLCADLTAQKLDFSSSEDGEAMLKEVLEKEPCFVFIDNALTEDRVNNLLPSGLRLSPGSRMLLTSRRADVIRGLRVRNIDCREYRVTELPQEDAIEYFRKMILRSEDINSPGRGNGISLARIDAVAKKCHGVPLILKVYAQYLGLHGRNSKMYDKILKALERGDYGVDGADNLSERLLYEYRRLGQTYQDAFVDICTYFHGWEMDKVSFIFSAAELETLVDAALVDIDVCNRVTVHDVLRAMGIKEGRETRMQSVDDLQSALAQKKELNGVKGMWLLHGDDLFDLDSQHLIAMSDCLRVLALGTHVRITSECKASFPKLKFLQICNPDDFSFLGTEPLEDLRYIKMGKCRKSPSSAPSQRMWENIMSQRNLEKLELQCCKLEKFPYSFRFPASLLDLDLSDCEDLQALPQDLVGFTKLKNLTLHGCVGLKILSLEFEQLVSLQRLDLSNCSRIETLPEHFGCLSSLESLDLSLCQSLKSLPDRFCALNALQVLDLSFCCSLANLPDGFGNLSNLQSLNLRECDNLISLPDDFGDLSCLQSLHLGRCQNLCALPTGFSHLSNLRSLHMGMCESLPSLPDGFGNITTLQSLVVNGCECLTNLPEGFGNLSSLQSLDLSVCENLTSLPDGFGNLHALQSLDLSGCYSLMSLADGFGNLNSLQSLDLSGCYDLMGLPDGFGNLNTLQSSKLRGCKSLTILPDEFDNLKTLRSLDLGECESLTSLPHRFGNLRNLQSLDLDECESLTSLSDGFGNLSVLQSLDLSGCKSLMSLPDGFGNLKLLERLNLSGCTSLLILPNGFGKLNWIKHLEMARCSALKTLSGDFECLGSVEYLGLYSCSELEGNTMERLVKLESLQLLDIRYATKLLMKWEEMEREKFILFVLTTTEDDDSWECFMRVAKASFLKNNCQLVDRTGKSTGSSDFFKVGTNVAFLLVCEELKGGVLKKLDNWVTLEKWQVIYIQTSKNCDEESILQDLQTLPDGSHAVAYNEIHIRSIFDRVLGHYSKAWHRRFLCIADVTMDDEGGKHFAHGKKDYKGVF